MANEKRLIDANAFIEDIKTEICNLRMDGLKGTPRPCGELYDIIDRIGEQPTVDAVEVVHGYWELSIFNHPMSYFVDHTCSVCGHMERLDICASPLKWNYCPNCGAKMDAKE